MTERKLAQEILNLQEKGPSLGKLFVPSRRRVVIRYLFVICVVAMILCQVFPPRVEWALFLSLGLVLGAWFRDFMTVLLQSRYWSFTQKVTKWDVVEELAKCKVCEKRKIDGGS